MNARTRKSVLSLVSNGNSRLERARHARGTDSLAASGATRLVEVFAGPRDAGAIGFALAQVPRGGRILWVQDRMAALEAGRPCGQALGRFGGDARQLVLACGRSALDVLWTMEEGLKCTSLSAIIGEIWGDPRVLDFTATKRLAIRAERQGVHVFLLRFGARPALSAARQRWRVVSLPSCPHPYDDRAPGASRWRAELFRARDGRPGVWEVDYDRAAHRLHLAAALSDPALETSAARTEKTLGRGAG